MQLNAMAASAAAMAAAPGHHRDDRYQQQRRPGAEHDPAGVALGLVTGLIARERVLGPGAGERISPELGKLVPGCDKGQRDDRSAQFKQEARAMSARLAGAVNEIERHAGEQQAHERLRPFHYPLHRLRVLLRLRFGDGTYHLSQSDSEQQPEVADGATEDRVERKTTREPVGLAEAFQCTGTVSGMNGRRSR